MTAAATSATSDASTGAAPAASTRAVGSPGRGAPAVLIAATLWGTTGTAATFAPDVGPLAIGAAAMGVGGLVQAATAVGAVGRSLPVLARHRGVVVLGALSVAGYPLAFYSSMHLAGVAVGTVVSIGSAPLASALVERLVDQQRLSRRWAVGALLGLVGLLLLCLAGATGSGTSGADGAGGAGGGTVGGVLLGLVAGLTYALYSWVAHRLMRAGAPSRGAMGAVFGLGGLALLPVLVVTGAPLVASWSNAAVGVYMALVPMFVGYWLFGHGLARVPASTATTLSLMEPAVAAVLAVVVVGERLGAGGWVGAGLVALCLVVLTVPTGARRRLLRWRV